MPSVVISDYNPCCKDLIFYHLQVVDENWLYIVCHWCFSLEGCGILASSLTDFRLSLEKENLQNMSLFEVTHIWKAGRWFTIYSFFTK